MRVLDAICLWCKPHLPANLRNAIDQDDLEIWEWKVYQLPQNGKTYFTMYRSMHVFGYEDVDSGEVRDYETEYVTFLTPEEINVWREESECGSPKGVPESDDKGEAETVEDWVFAEKNVSGLVEGLDLKQAQEGMRADYSLTWLIKWIEGRKAGAEDIGVGSGSEDRNEKTTTSDSPSTIGTYAEISDLESDFAQDMGLETPPPPLPTIAGSFSETPAREVWSDFPEPQEELSLTQLESLLRRLDEESRQGDIEFARMRKEYRV
jgi:hypothetical protein